ncbi:hypothetical protein ACF1BQ_044065 [Bradyrhizobium sp. RDT10]
MNDEKIISQPRLELIKMKCPVSRRAFSSYASVSKRAAKTRALQNRKIEFRQKTGAIPA